MLPDLRKLVGIWILSFAVSIGLPVPATEAASPEGDPENLASAIFFTKQVESEFLYCFVDIEFRSYPETENCEKSRVKLGLLAREMKLDGVDVKDDRIFLRVIVKLFSIYNERLIHRDR
ncbi:hypothetical protein B5K11_12275 [Rhizobium leguminosarum bv. trifolii]|uniref:hypothetical protein n=1 Tax=Rhizobium leguminosarum TaxID=384 RepID=UPI000E2E570E|nr:hypothetical protein [Rhizobium leguminosarum]RFB95669.1 hypothetical protein B5K11_12275 [Rhizobium leguminosarum bv. trifolii]